MQEGEEWDSLYYKPSAQKTIKQNVIYSSQQKLQGKSLGTEEEMKSALMSTLNKIYEEGDDDMKQKIRDSYVIKTQINSRHKLSHSRRKWEFLNINYTEIISLVN